MLRISDWVAAAQRAGGTTAFDADGTLWADDLGESFLRTLEAEGRVPRGAWAEYERRHETEPADAYAWSALALEGLEEGWVRDRAASFFAAHFRQRIFPAIRTLLEALQAAEVEVAIVSASQHWVVEAAGRELGIEKVAGVAVAGSSGRIGGRLVEPIPVGAGKVHWARKLLGRTPGLAVGNGTIDEAMLDAAHHRLVICPEEEPETDLARTAHGRGWRVLALAHPCPGEPLP